MPCCRCWLRARSRRDNPHRSPMPMTSVVSAMTSTHRVKDTARRRRLPRSFEARSPAKEPGLLFFIAAQPHPAPGPPRRRRALRSARSFTTCTERLPTPSAPRSTLAGAELRLGRPAPSRVCPRTSTGRPGVHVRSGGRLSRAATQLRLAQAGRVACGHSRDGSTPSPLASSRFEGRKPAATIGRRRNPSPTTFHPCLGSSVGRAPA
jgi:hypothetical protein